MRKRSALDVLFRSEQERQERLLDRYVRQRPRPKCVYCGTGITRAGASVDHILAFSRGGLPGTHNEVLACRSCNNLKGSDDLSLFRHRKAVVALGWPPGITQELVGWARDRDADISDYDAYQFHYETAEASMGDVIRLVEDALSSLNNVCASNVPVCCTGLKRAHML